MEEPVKKACSPHWSMVFLGILFDTRMLTWKVTPGRLDEISYLLCYWVARPIASWRDMQVLLGKLHFVSACIRQG